MIDLLSYKIGKSAGGGLPDPSSYSDGTVLIKVGDEWKAQSGYGYESEAAFEPITWDGDTEGRLYAEIEYEGQRYPVAYKVSDEIIPYSAMRNTNNVMAQTYDDESNEGTFGEWFEDSIDEVIYTIGENGSGVYSHIYSCGAGIQSVIVGDETAEVYFPESGTYFQGGSLFEGLFTSKLTAPSSVQTIDPKLIGKVEEWTFTLADDTTVTKKIFVVEE